MRCIACFQQACGVTDPNPCLVRVVSNVFSDTTQFFQIASHVIVVFLFPKRTGFAEFAIYLVRRKRFPGMQNVSELVVAKRFHEHMHVVGHYDPLVQFISFAVEVREGIGNNFRNFRIP